ncbi:DUF2752 domain-containing protein [Maribacter sp. MMG018]|uniref:DUF2752 domain-containing protein n=1 Tax=Maribacter sp. MMG018 TaxID=2822688 RepID=UPI00249592F8|nr:DUF2752 domain-containing protein [Maribacter sp. MMG018]
MLPCFTKQVFDMDCPGCGLQRSLLFLIRGEFVSAFKMYPGIYPMLLLFLFLLINKSVNIKFSNLITNVLMIITAGTIIINYTLKFI